MEQSDMLAKYKREKESAYRNFRLNKRFMAFDMIKMKGER
jgi:hypothetical protein